MAAVAKIINHPRVYDHLTDDLSPEVYVPDSSRIYIINEEATGVIRLDPLTGTCCLVHIAAMPELWGKTKEFVREVIEWGWANTCYSKAQSLTPVFIPLAIRLAKSCGFKQEGILKKSYLKNFKLYDQVLLGLSKYEHKEN